MQAPQRYGQIYRQRGNLAKFERSHPLQTSCQQPISYPLHDLAELLGVGVGKLYQGVAELFEPLAKLVDGTRVAPAPAMMEADADLDDPLQEGPQGALCQARPLALEDLVRLKEEAAIEADPCLQKGAIQPILRRRDACKGCHRRQVDLQGSEKFRPPIPQRVRQRDLLRTLRSFRDHYQSRGNDKALNKTGRDIWRAPQALLETCQGNARHERAFTPLLVQQTDCRDKELQKHRRVDRDEALQEQIRQSVAEDSPHSDIPPLRSSPKLSPVRMLVLA
jgi:hypothetical protein